TPGRNRTTAGSPDGTGRTLCRQVRCATREPLGTPGRRPSTPRRSTGPRESRLHLSESVDGFLADLMHGDRALLLRLRDIPDSRAVLHAGAGGHAAEKGGAADVAL